MSLFATDILGVAANLVIIGIGAILSIYVGAAVLYQLLQQQKKVF